MTDETQDAQQALFIRAIELHNKMDALSATRNRIAEEQREIQKELNSIQDALWPKWFKERMKQS